MSTANETTAVLLMAYGSPETIQEVAPYFTHIRGGTRPDQHLITNLEERYKQVGGKTPLVEITRQQAKELQELLDKTHGQGSYKVFVGMQHWHPYIKEVLKQIEAEGIKKVVAIALAPHYSKMSIGGYQKALNEFKDEVKGELDIKLIESWHTNEHLLDCIEEQLQDALAVKQFTGQPHIVFSAHSLPKRIREWSDPYEAQLLETSKILAERFPEYSWSFSFQSAGHTGEPWIGPDILENLEILKGQGKHNILICSVGFVSDNLEIVFDLDIEAKQKAKELGINLERTEMRNTHPLFIQALASLVIDKL